MAAAVIHSKEERREIAARSLNGEQMYTRLLEQVWVETNSNKNRARLRELLEGAGKQWTEEHVGYTDGRGIDLCEWTVGAKKHRVHSYAHGMGDYAAWIRGGRIAAADVEAVCREDSRFDFDDVRAAWEGGHTHAEVVRILTDAWGMAIEDHTVYKYFPLNCVRLRKPITRLTLTVADE